MSRLRLAFMGTPDFAVPSLDALVAAGHDVVAVYTQPPRPAGRGHRVQPSPVQAWAEARGLPVHCPKSLRTAEAQSAFAALRLDAAVVAAYGLILPAPVLQAPRLGCFNVHASLLPRWRGAAPIQRAIMAGDKETGISIMQMDEGLDTGPVVLIRALPIDERATAATLHDGLAALGAELIVEALAGVAEGRLTARPQASEGVTYAEKIDKAEGRLDWTRPAPQLARQVRGLSPWPGAWTEYEGQRLKVLKAEVCATEGPAGTLLDDGLTVACGKGSLRLLRVQRAGKAPMTAADFLRGTPIAAGAVLA